MLDKLLDAIPKPYRSLAVAAVCGGVLAWGYFGLDSRVTAAETTAIEARAKVTEYERKADEQRTKINDKIDGIGKMVDDTRTIQAVTTDQVNNLKEMAARSERKIDQVLDIELRRGR